MITVCNLDAGCGKHTVCKGGFDFDTVDINLCRSRIQAGNVINGILILIRIKQEVLILYCRGKIENIACSGNDVSLDQSSRAVKIDLIENGVFSVFNRIGIVNGKVIDIVGIVTVDGAVRLPKHIVNTLMENESQEEFARFAGHAVGGILVVPPVSRKHDLGELTYVRGDIMPTGFIDVIVNILGLHQADDVIGIKDAVSVGVCLVVELYPALDIILGNIEPETDSLCVFKRDRLAVNTETDPGILLGVRIRGGKTVGFQTHGIFTVVNLAVFSVSQAQIQIIIPMLRILSVVDHVPLVNIRLTAFKVPKNLGALAEIELYGRGGVCTHIERCGNRTGEIIGCTRFAYSGKFKTVKATERSVGRGKGYVIFSKTDFISNAVNGSRCLYGDRGGLTKRNRHYRLFKRKLVGRSNGNRLFADNLAVINHLNGNLALGTVGFEHTVFNRTHAGFLDLPLYVGGNIHLGTNGIGSESTKFYGTTGGIVVVIGRDLRARKLTVCGSSRNNKDRIRGRTLTAVGQGAVDLQILAGTLRAESSGTTAVTVSGNYTAHLDHVLCHLIGSKAC